MNKKGYDPSLLDTPNDTLICRVCKLIPRDVMTCDSCNSIFCKKCIHSNKCPNKCKANSIKPASLIIKNIIGALSIKCSQGCGNYFKIDDIDRHEEKCKQPRCASAICFVPESQIKKPIFVTVGSQKKKVCSELCKFMVMLEPIVEEGNYQRILKTSANLLDEYSKSSELHAKCEEKLNELLNQLCSGNAIEAPPNAQPIVNPNPNPAQINLPVFRANIPAAFEFVWDPEYCSSGITISNNGKSVFLEENGYCFRSIIADKGVIGGRAYWEIHGDPRTENELKIGVTASRNFNLNTAFCDYDFGWAFYGLGQLRHGNNSSGPKFGKCFKNAGVLGICLDLIKGTLSYSLNGELMGTAFTDSGLKKGPIYPAVSLLHKAGFSIKTGLQVPSYFP